MMRRGDRSRGNVRCGFSGFIRGLCSIRKSFCGWSRSGSNWSPRRRGTAGHQVRLIDLQVEDHRAYFRTIERWRPDIVAFSCNYLANVPEIVDLAKATKARFPGIFICVGGHSASFTAAAIIAHGDGAIDCVLKGEGEAAMPLLLAAIEAGRDAVTVPGAVTAAGEGRRPALSTRSTS